MMRKYMVINDRVHEIRTVVVHRFTVSDVDDPELYAAEPLAEWQSSEQGQWVMSHAIEQPIWHKHNNWMNYAVQFAITARLKDRDYTYWALKWGSK